MKKILIASDTPWNTNNSFGNSYANIFDGLEGYEIANIYCKEGVVNDPRISRAFKMTAKMLIKNLLDHKCLAGKEVYIENIKGDKYDLNSRELAIINFGKKHRFQIFFWLYGLIWRIGRWNGKELRSFVEDYNPDILFCPIYRMPYMNRIVLALKKMTGLPLAGYISDDNYTLNVVSFSPLFWINRLIERKWVKKVIDQCDILYVISDIQKEEYDSIFRKDCRILTKGFDFTDNEIPKPKEMSPPFKLLYAGNIGKSRWKSLAEIASVIREINVEQGQQVFLLTIYTATPLTSKMRKKLYISGSCEVLGRIPYSDVIKKQYESDILVHATSMDFVNRWAEHQGFSTKIVDYLSSGRAILAYGLDDQASIFHLKKNEAALVATNRKQLKELLIMAYKNPGIIDTVSKAAWRCGEKFHNIQEIHKMLNNDFDLLINLKRE